MAEKKKSEPTRYHVLRLARPASTSSTSGSSPRTNAAWELVAEDVEANGAEQAVRAYAEKNAPELEQPMAVTLVAVPSRSWKPTQIRVESELRVRFGAKAKRS